MIDLVKNSECFAQLHTLFGPSAIITGITYIKESGEDGEVGSEHTMRFVRDTVSSAKHMAISPSTYMFVLACTSSRTKV